jgi:hypothetical protein
MKYIINKIYFITGVCSIGFAKVRKDYVDKNKDCGYYIADSFEEAISIFLKEPYEPFFLYEDSFEEAISIFLKEPYEPFFLYEDSFSLNEKEKQKVLEVWNTYKELL